MNVDAIIKALRAFIEAFKPTPMPPDPKGTLQKFCLAIKEHEGWFAPGERANGIIYTRGSRSYRNNNPGNFRCSPEGYLPKYGNVTCIDGFAHFESYALGWMYLVNSIKNRAKNHPYWTIYQFFEHYAPVSDGNDPIAYAKLVAQRCGVSPSVTMQALGFNS